MQDQINNTNNFIKNNIKWVVVVVFGIIILWLNSKYALRDDVLALEKEIEQFKLEFLLHKQQDALIIEHLKTGHNIINERLNKKIETQNKQHDQIDDIELTLKELEVKLDIFSKNK